MPPITHLILVALLAAISFQAPAAPIAIAIHGGAGTIERKELGAEQEAAIRADLKRARNAGYAVLESGGEALDAVTAVITVLEDSPYFNAGKGAVFTAEGTNELDASIMDGANLRAGAVAGLTHIKNPILLARAVMERSVHVMMIGAGAETFAREVGMEFVDPGYFRTDARWQQYLKAKAEAAALKPQAMLPVKRYFGTVGAVALDQKGHLAAGTSTGGMTLKRYGRVGDAPIIGAGTYADDRCAVSATGWGEYFIRLAVAHDICARVRYAGQSIAQASDTVIMERVPALGGDGGVIVLDAQGHVHMPFNTSGMYRAAIDGDGKRSIAIYKPARAALVP
jgi:beta-aspartyl-peptidase (threonine type)